MIGNSMILKPIEVIITDDHQLIIDGLKAIIEKSDLISFVAQCNDGKDLVDTLDKITCDVVLLDIDMPVMNGMEACRIIKSNQPKIKIIIISMHQEKAIIKKVMEFGADGYLLKNCDTEELTKAITKVYNGGKYFSGEVALSLLNEDKTSNQNSLELLAELTEREKEILVLIAEGYSNKEIGEKLFISHRTVDTHRTNLTKKLNVKNIAGLIRFAYTNGLVK